MNKSEYSLDKIISVITELFNNKKNAVITVTGYSMTPLLYNLKSRVVLQKANPENIAKYDIILYKNRSGKYLLHRVIKVNQNTVNCCGDNQVVVERSIKKENILGKVVAFNRKSGNDFTYCTNFFYKIYCVLWVALRPYRPKILKLNKKLRGNKK